MSHLKKLVICTECKKTQLMFNELDKKVTIQERNLYLERQKVQELQELVEHYKGTTKGVRMELSKTATASRAQQIKLQQRADFLGDKLNDIQEKVNRRNRSRQELEEELEHMDQRIVQLTTHHENEMNNAERKYSDLTKDLEGVIELRDDATLKCNLLYEEHQNVLCQVEDLEQQNQQILALMNRINEECADAKCEVSQKELAVQTLKADLVKSMGAHTSALQVEASNLISAQQQQQAEIIKKHDESAKIERQLRSSLERVTEALHITTEEKNQLKEDIKTLVHVEETSRVKKSETTIAKEAERKQRHTKLGNLHSKVQATAQELQSEVDQWTTNSEEEEEQEEEKEKEKETEKEHDHEHDASSTNLNVTTRDMQTEALEMKLGESEANLKESTLSRQQLEVTLADLKELNKLLQQRLEEQLLTSSKNGDTSSKNGRAWEMQGVGVGVGVDKLKSENNELCTRLSALQEQFTMTQDDAEEMQRELKQVVEDQEFLLELIDLSLHCNKDKALSNHNRTPSGSKKENDPLASLAAASLDFDTNENNDQARPLSQQPSSSRTNYFMKLSKSVSCDANDLPLASRSFGRSTSNDYNTMCKLDEIKSLARGRKIKQLQAKILHKTCSNDLIHRAWSSEIGLAPSFGSNSTELGM